MKFHTKLFSLVSWGLSFFPITSYALSPAMLTDGPRLPWAYVFLVMLLLWIFKR